MTVKTVVESPAEPTEMIDEVNRVLEVGRLLLSVLMPEELEELQGLLYGEWVSDNHDMSPIGNTIVT
jgi:hypothetical protein